MLLLENDDSTIKEKRYFCEESYLFNMIIWNAKFSEDL